MAIERRLTEIVGPGRRQAAHRPLAQRPGRDRHGDVHARARARRRSRSCSALQSVLVQLAERHEDWAMPGYTHLQRAQPVYLSHHLLAYFWMFRRDARRFEFVLGSTSELPLGAGALAGVNFATDRGLRRARARLRGRRAELDRRRLQPRLRARLPRRGGDLRDAPLAARRRDRAVVLGGVRLRRACRTPGRRAPRSCRRRRTPTRRSCCAAKAPRVAARLVALHGVLHGLPLTYNKDMQEDKEHLFDAVDTLDLCLAGGRRDARGDRVRPRAARRRGGRRADRGDRHRRPARAPRRPVPPVARHRRRHRARGARDAGGRCRSSRARSSRATPRRSTTSSTTVLAQRSWLESKVSEGGTALARVREQLSHARAELEGQPA